MAPIPVMTTLLRIGVLNRWYRRVVLPRVADNPRSLFAELPNHDGAALASLREAQFHEVRLLDRPRLARDEYRTGRVRLVVVQRARNDAVPGAQHADRQFTHPAGRAQVAGVALGGEHRNGVPA